MTPGSFAVIARSAAITIALVALLEIKRAVQGKPELEPGFAFLTLVFCSMIAAFACQRSAK